jgi:hypothetical protein
MVFHFNLTPGLSSGEPMNSMPDFSKAFLRESMVLILPEGTPSDSSNRLIVEIPTPDIKAKSIAVIFSKALAALS